MVSSGTIKEDSNFDVEADVSKIRIALKEGIGQYTAMETTVAQILVQRSNNQRQVIDQQYRSVFNTGICDDLQNEINKGNFLETVKALLSKPIHYDANCLHDAIMNGNESVICEVLCTKTYSEISELLLSYETEFETTIREDLESYISDHRTLYLAVLESPRDSIDIVDEAQLSHSVNILIEAEQSKWKMSGSPEVLNLLCHHNFSHLRAAFKEFQKRENGNMEMIESSIRKICEDELTSMFLVMWVKSIKNVAMLYSELLYQSVTSLTADTARVIRIVTGRSEIDLVQIKSYYMMQYNKQLQLAVQQKCGNDTAYSNIITMIIKN